MKDCKALVARLLPAVRVADALLVATRVYLRVRSAFLDLSLLVLRVFARRLEFVMVLEVRLRESLACLKVLSLISPTILPTVLRQTAFV